jgi:hypothetical protein
MNRVLVEKPEGKSSLGRPRRRIKDDIMINLQKVGWVGSREWIDLAQDRAMWRVLANAVINLRENAGGFSTSCRQVSFSRRTLLSGISEKENAGNPT